MDVKENFERLIISRKFLLTVLSRCMDTETSDTPYALVVDDDLIIRKHVERILRKAGFLVLAANHAEAAIDLLHIRHPNIVLLFTDVQMPGQLDGFALARSVASSWPHISIVVASGLATPSPGAMPEKARYIGKPFSADLVHAYLQELLPDGQKPEPLKRAKSPDVTV